MWSEREGRETEGRLLTAANTRITHQSGHILRVLITLEHLYRKDIHFTISPTKSPQ